MGLLLALFLLRVLGQIVAVARQSAPLGAAAPRSGTWIIGASYVYALGMLVRLIRYVRAAPERRGVLIPIIFHVVLAAFLFTYGHALTR